VTAFGVGASKGIGFHEKASKFHLQYCTTEADFYLKK
jgi:hypothetical protein